MAIEPDEIIARLLVGLTAGWLAFVGAVMFVAVVRYDGSLTALA